MRPSDGGAIAASLTSFLLLAINDFYKKIFHSDMPALLIWAIIIGSFFLGKEIVSDLEKKKRRKQIREQQIREAAAARAYRAQEQARNRQTVLDLQAKYPEASKYFVRLNWNIRINDFSALNNQLSNDAIKILLSYSESQYHEKEKELSSTYRAKLEREKLRKEAEIQSLPSCVSSWTYPRTSSVKCFSLYNYYPTTCGWEANQEEWSIRKLIWNFKANPHTYASLETIDLLHSSAVRTVIPKIADVLRYFFGHRLVYLTIVCIPSSKQEVTEKRYKDFSTILTNETGMINGFGCINVVKDGGAKHLGQQNESALSIDYDFLKGKQVLLFDDVITSGSSMERIARLLEKAGARVIGGISIGKTCHNREASHPIDKLGLWGI